MLSEELARALSRMSELSEQAERADKLARRIETQFKHATDTIAIGGLSQELGQLLQKQRQSLPDLRAYRRAADERKDMAVEIGVRRLGHWKEAARLGDLDGYVAELMAGGASEAAAPDASALREQLRDLALGRQGLLEKALEADDIYLRKLGKPTTDRFSDTLIALGLTFVAAAAWQLKVSVEATDFTSAVGKSLLAGAIQLYYLRAFHLICMPGGVAAAHFRWPESSLRLLHPKRGVLVGYTRGARRPAFRHLHRLLYPLLVIYPLGLGVLSLMGYRYTASNLFELLLSTVWFAVELILIAALAERWILVTRRRLAYDAAMERRQTFAEEERSAGTPPAGREADGAHEAEEPEVDLVTLSGKSRRLLNTAILFYGLFGLWVLWSDLFPALRILDQITLWYHTVTVDGEAQVQPITLATVGLALFYAAITVILARQLPAALEILLLQYTEMSAGGRYTVTTLTNYAIVTVGVSLAFNAVGTDWSKLQWLVAALGVGIGFGLQEIVANFISGIILLFERPIRIGDVVTVGDTDGVVTRIRGRATTIRNWDGKELLVPNKEFITGRLLNWSLSDQVTRIILSVGIAYGSDVRQAMRLLEEAAREHQNVLDDPPPSVIFEAFGDNSLAMGLRCFVDTTDLRYPTISALNEVINDKFNAAGIVIAFPQRDLHLNTIRPLQVELRQGTEVTRGGGAGGNPGPDCP